MCSFTVFPAQVRPRVTRAWGWKGEQKKGKVPPASLGPLSHTVSHSPRALGVVTLFDPPQTIPSTVSHSSGNSGMCSWSQLLCSLGAAQGS